MNLAKSKVYFIGIGGIGMSGLAELLHNMGAQVEGSDQAENQQTQHLTHIGVKIHKGHNDSNPIENFDVVVYSSAISPDNIEFKKARKLKIPLIARAEALAEIMRLKRGIAIGGTHGKTTTTSLAASIFLKAKLDPTIVVGGRLDVIKSTALLGQGDWLVAEADESDGSFSRLSPEIVIVTNIDNDHIDFYKTFDGLKMAFYDFASRIPFYGVLICCGDDKNIKEVFEHFPKKIIYYGFESNNDYVLKGEKGQYQIFFEGKKIGDMKIPISGKHNALNALASVIAGLHAGISIEQCLTAISQFGGVDRRFQFKGKFNDVEVYDDYGHHPTEVEAVLKAFRERFEDKKIVVLFQLHRFSRTQLCWAQFLNCFKDADQVYLLDIYPAGEKPIEGIDSQTLSAQVKTKNCKYIGTKENAYETLKQRLGKDCVFVTLGAGDVWKVGEKLVNP